MNAEGETRARSLIVDMSGRYNDEQARAYNLAIARLRFGFVNIKLVYADRHFTFPFS